MKQTLTDPLAFGTSVTKFLFRSPHQYLEESVPNSSKLLKQSCPLVYYYLSLRPVNRLLRHLNTKVFLVSYPKCGRTWLRLLIGKYLAEHFELQQEDLLDVKQLSKKHESIPRILINHDDEPHYRRRNELESWKYMYRGKSVLFLVRDPRDVIVSRYHHVRSREGRREQADSLSDFIRSEPGSFQTIVRYYNIWLANATIPGSFLLIRYEDMQEDTERELRRALDFLEIEEVQNNLLREAVEYARFDNMRKMEEENTFDSGGLQKGEADSENAYKTRKGEVGGYREEVPDQAISYMNEVIKSELDPRLGYGE